MQLENLQARLRPRSSWEAMDLGFAMLRRWWWPVARAWSVTVLPMMILLAVLGAWRPGVAAVLTWWLKPLWDRPVLFVLSRALFGATPTPREVLGAKLWRAELFSALTWRRPDPARSFIDPIRSLEGQRGRQARRRRRDLTAKGATGPAIALLVGCLLMEIAVTLGLIGVVMMFLPDSPRYALETLIDQLILGDAPLWLGPMLLFAYIGAVSFVEPLYVAGGFGLYINRRTWLEGWDVELSFRQLSDRLRKIGAVLLAMLLMLPATARAEPPDPQAEIEAVLSRPEFGDTEMVETYQIREEVWELWEWLFDRDEQDRPELAAIAEVVRIALLVLLGVGIVAIVLMLIRQGSLRLPSRTAQRPALPEDARGLTLMAPAPLPPDIAQQARQQWEAGRPEIALSMLYRGALVRMIDVFQAEIEEGATEAECLRIADALLPDGPRQTFRRLTRSWIQTAYGRRPPPLAEGLALCDAWSVAFGAS
ncbi:MAG: DUF4129 domain-containing protein [Myxococcota bacterium]